VKRIGLALLAVAGAGVVGVAVSDGQPPAAFRFTGYVEGANSGPGHAFVVGDGLNLAFRDDVGGRTRYRVCWARRATRPRCWVRRTGRIGLTSKIFTAAPANVGVYVTRWYVSGRVVASWRLYNGPGD
jgi:hypothetical protein